MKHVDVEAAVALAVPVEPKKMTREQKLMHWAGLVRCAGSDLGLYHLLEYSTDEQLSLEICSNHSTALGVAARDGLLERQGLTDKSILGVMRFMEIEKAQLHEFSCDCGGTINNRNQALRIEYLARIGGGGAGMARIVNGITRHFR